MTRGQRGDAIKDLQRRLGAAGYPPVGAEAGVFCPATEDAVSSFQLDRGLHHSGSCDEATWLAICEAGFALGDRRLVISAPMLRGDDVADLQQRLNHLGFDCGRPDGIYGPATGRALVDFQRNSGLLADGVCGPTTVAALRLLSRQSGTGPGVASIREADSDRFRESVPGLRVVVGQFGGLSSIARPLSRALRESGAIVMSTDEYDAAAQAAAANRFGAAAYVGFDARVNACSIVSYYAVPSFESVGGRSLAALIATELEPVLDSPPTLQGMRLPVLRETRMPAVLCSIGPVRNVVDRTDRITSAVTAAVAAWSVAPSRENAGESRGSGPQTT